MKTQEGEQPESSINKSIVCQPNNSQYNTAPQNPPSTDSKDIKINKISNQERTNTQPKTPTKQQHTFQVFIGTTKRNVDNSGFTRASIIYIQLQAFQLSNPDTYLILPKTTLNQKNMISIIDTHKKDIKSSDHRKLEFLLHTNTEGNVFGNFHFRSSTKYSTIKKNIADHAITTTILHNHNRSK
jgi:hypothetical protein